MNPTPYTIVLVVLALILVAIFALGLYWLATKDRPTSPQSSTPAFPAPSFAAVDECDEWESNAHLHEHEAHTICGNGNDSRDTQPPFRKRTSPRAPDIDDMRDELREALWGEQHDASASVDVGPHADYVAPGSPPPSPSPSPSDSTPRCPHCRSSRIDTLNRARKAGSTIGSVAGATSGMAIALSGAEAGAFVGSIAGPVGTVFGGLAGAVIAGLAGSAAGCAAGSAVGAAIDDNVLDNHLCLSCGHAFSAARS